MRPSLHHPPHHLAAWACVAVALLLSRAHGAERHPHSGKVPPFVPGDPGIRLGPDALKILRGGLPYRTQIQSGTTGGRGVVVQDVEAPPDVVWDRILDFAAYPKMVPKTVESDVYRREHLKRGVQRIWVRMKVGFPILKLQFYVEHHYDPSQRSMTWTLDYSRRSDLDDSVGFWYVVPHPDRPRDASRVYYSVDVSLFSWVPHFVVEFMSQQALVDATAWVKKYSELAQQSATRKEPGTGTGAGTGAGAGGSLAVSRPWWWRRWWIGGTYASTSSSAVDGPSAAALGDGDAGAAARHQANGDPAPGGSAREGNPIDATAGTHLLRERDAVGPKRYALVTTVLALVLYNVHLYFSQ